MFTSTLLSAQLWVISLQIQNYFGIGKIYSNKAESAQYRVESVKQLEILINHFDSYGLITQKWSDYQLFKKGIELLKNKEHLTREGINKLIAIKASLNLGLSDELKTAFPEVVPVNRPIVSNQNIPDPMWIAGFTSAEGNFDVRLPQSNSKTGYRVQLRFRITQHTRDLKLMEKIVQYFGAGQIYKYTKSAVHLNIVDFSLITTKIIPLFQENPWSLGCCCISG